ncbi:putative U4/U6 small nuclear ribonucleoprotein Prp4-like 2 [Homarus americanus]|uniref:Putative U4/U6 small nuclear ribonucleoprotein Prp4-like 2 n=1 Tax=Homarus americanus TaxID=6706 RepID=A0A8J5JYV8_HOMAM|nr:putative U4/U6 small nuclear ribonucleoprotein Prp4-like 2 [Homarus americanus]
MSDGEDSPVVVGGGGVSERQWYAPDTAMSGAESPPDSPDSPVNSANIHTSNEYMELDEPEMLDEKKALLEEFERKRRARMIHVTTDDSEVSMALVTASKKFQVQQHLKTSKHIRLEAVKSNSAQKEQQLLLACSSKSGPDRSQFPDRSQLKKVSQIMSGDAIIDETLHKEENETLKQSLTFEESGEDEDKEESSIIPAKDLKDVFFCWSKLSKLAEDYHPDVGAVEKAIIEMINEVHQEIVALANGVVGFEEVILDDVVELL